MFVFPSLFPFTISSVCSVKLVTDRVELPVVKSDRLGCAAGRRGQVRAAGKTIRLLKQSWWVGQSAGLVCLPKSNGSFRIWSSVFSHITLI